MSRVSAQMVCRIFVGTTPLKKLLKSCVISNFMAFVVESYVNHHICHLVAPYIPGHIVYLLHKQLLSQSAVSTISGH